MKPLITDKSFAEGKTRNALLRYFTFEVFLSCIVFVSGFFLFVFGSGINQPTSGINGDGAIERNPMFIMGTSIRSFLLVGIILGVVLRLIAEKKTNSYGNKKVMIMVWLMDFFFLAGYIVSSILCVEYETRMTETGNLQFVAHLFPLPFFILIILEMLAFIFKYPLILKPIYPYQKTN